MHTQAATPTHRRRLKTSFIAAILVLLILLIVLQLWGIGGDVWRNIARTNNEKNGKIRNFDQLSSGLTLVSIVTQPQVENLRRYVDSLKSNHVFTDGTGPGDEESFSIAVYGIGLKREQRREIDSWDNVMLLDVSDIDFSTDWTVEELMGLGNGKEEEMESDSESESDIGIPSIDPNPQLHTHEHKHGGILDAKWYHLWQFVAIQDAIERFGSVLYVDVSYSFSKSLLNAKSVLDERGYLFIDHHNHHHEHDRMDITVAVEDGSTKEKEKDKLSDRCTLAVQGYSSTTSAKNIILPLSKCALDRKCYNKLWKKHVQYGGIPGTGLNSGYPCVSRREAADMLGIVLEVEEKVEEKVEKEKEKEVEKEEIKATPIPTTTPTSSEGEGEGKNDKDETKDTPIPTLTPTPTNTTSTSKSSFPKDYPHTIALLVPSTTRGQAVTSPSQLPLFTIFIPSIKTTIDATDKRYKYVIYLGYDEGDAYYDNESNQIEIEKAVKEAMSDVSLDMSIVMHRALEASGSPCWVWNALLKVAYEDGCHFFFQLNDDIQFHSPGWTHNFVETLKKSPIMKGFGATGPRDQGNDRTMTQSFVSRVHFDIFQTYYPPAFTNWYSDDWITWVYSEKYTWRPREFTVKNMNPHGTRYVIKDAKDFLTDALQEACEKIATFLKSHESDIVDKSAADSWACGDKMDRSGFWWDLERRRRRRRLLLL